MFLNKIENIGAQERIRVIQNYALNRVFDYSRLSRMIENKLINGNLSYSIQEMILDINKGIWGDLSNTNPIELYKRNLQKSYINIFIDMMENEKTQSNYYKRFGANIKFSESDIRPIILGELKDLQEKFNIKSKKIKDKETRNHLQYLKMMIDKVINKS